MNLVKPYRFFNDQNAAMWIPIRLLISITIISFFTGLVVFGSQIATDTIHQDQFTNQLLDFKQSIESLYHHGECRNLNQPTDQSGSTRMFQFIVPHTISSVYIGKKPAESSEFMSSIRYQTKTETTLIWINSEIQLITGVNKDDQFYPHQNQTGLSLTPGSYSITVELVCNETDQFILIYH
ncbi:MAG: hypothetical protein KGY67_05545 [Candidatus Thermoplasmatota archaeon]|nr:hypothetical protein [Candidatus Thermoplasmatota archaeon]